MRASSSSSRRRDEVKGQDRAVVAQQPSSNTERERVRERKKRSSTLFRLEIITHILRQERLCAEEENLFLIIFSSFSSDNVNILFVLLRVARLLSIPQHVYTGEREKQEL